VHEIDVSNDIAIHTNPRNVTIVFVKAHKFTILPINIHICNELKEKTEEASQI
jgi:hypothetical protein